MVAFYRGAPAPVPGTPVVPMPLCAMIAVADFSGHYLV